MLGSLPTFLYIRYVQGVRPGAWAVGCILEKGMLAKLEAMYKGSGLGGLGSGLLCENGTVGSYVRGGQAWVAWAVHCTLEYGIVGSYVRGVGP